MKKDKRESESSASSVSRKFSSLYGEREKYQPLSKDTFRAKQSGGNISNLRKQQEKEKRTRRFFKYFSIILWLIVLGYGVVLGRKVVESRSVQAVAPAAHHGLASGELDELISHRERVWSSAAIGVTRAGRYLEEGNAEEAARLLEDIRYVLPNHVKANLMLATVYVGKGRLLDAARLYLEVLDFEPDRPDVRHALEELVTAMQVSSTEDEPVEALEAP